MSAADAKPKAAIAIVGMAGRFPGARNCAQFWRNLRAGVESLTHFTDAELLANGVDPALLANPAYVKAGTVLERVDEFDAGFFGFNPREAGLMDPQHRIFLECAWEALEDTGYDVSRLKSPVGVFAGASMNSYVFANLLANPEVLATAGPYQTMIANDKDFLATRVSYKLNLHGPSLTLQTACSTSLVAVHVACESLLNHQCDMALAGGVSLTFPQHCGYLYQEGMIFSPDGHVRPFDADGGGIRAGAGAGIVVLKRLEDALAAGDNIRAVILGTAINNDGARKIGYTAPSVDGQVEVIATAQSVAGVDPASIGYVEAHGTATPLGDPIEIAALTKAFGAGVSPRSCAIGSVKSNIGHLDAAAGVAGLIKTVLALQHRELPPSLHFKRPNPEIDFAASPFYVNAQLRSWPGEAASRRAGVSSFGIGGTNAHAVLEEAPPVAAAAVSQQQSHLLVLSARSGAALDAAAARLAEFFGASPDVSLADVAYTLQTGRKVFEHRRLIRANSVADAREALTTDRRRPLSARRESVERNVAFLFSGQGSQHVGMAQRLYATERVFRESMDACAARLELPALTDAVDIDETALAQPMLFAVEYSLAQLWIHRGVTPRALLGHSIGEYAAACVAGVFSLDSALEIVAARGRLMQQMPPGAMLAVPVDEAEVAAYLNDLLTVAVINAPGMSVVAGPIVAIEELERELEAAGLPGRRLRTSHAFHSSMMEPAVAPFVATVSRHRLSAPRIPFISNVTGTWITDAQATDPAYWGRHLRSPVRFADGVRVLAADPTRLLIEVGPGSTLKTLARQCLPGAPDDAVICSLPPIGEATPDDEFMLTALGRAWLAGASVRWESLHEHRNPRRVALPTYPFEGQHCWVNPVARQKSPAPAGAAAELQRMADVRDWFALPSWQRCGALESPVEGAKAGRWLVFADESPACAALLDKLSALGIEPVAVFAGETFESLSPRSFRIVPDSREHYIRLIKELGGGESVGCIAHLWNTGATLDLGRRLGFYSLLFLAQALEESPSGVALPVLVVTTAMHRVLGNEVPEPSRALLVGPALVMPQDVPFLQPRLIDLAAGDWNAAQAPDLAAALLAETVQESTQNIVAYRGGFRWVFNTSRIRLEPTSTAPLRQRGVYLITGGLGGIGLAIARHLAAAVQARLVLVTRNVTQERILGVPELESLGAEVLCLAADVADEAAMRGVVETTHTRFGKIHGVVHAAGLGSAGLLPLKTLELAEPVLRPKVEGTLILDRVLAGEELDFLLLSSSMNSVYGFPGSTDYSSANAFQDAFAQSGLARSTKRVLAINWGPWAEVGMAVRHGGLGPNAIGTAEGLDALLRALSSRQRQLFVTPIPMSQLLANAAIQTQRWQSEYFGSATAADAATAGDATGTPGIAPTQQTRPELSTAFAAPSTKREQGLCALWTDLLGVTPVGIDDNFFDLGGHSLLATRILARVQGAFQVRLTLRDVFDAPTVRSMAARIDGVASSSAAPQTVVAAVEEEEREEIEF